MPRSARIFTLTLTLEARPVKVRKLVQDVLRTLAGSRQSSSDHMDAGLLFPRLDLIRWSDKHMDVAEIQKELDKCIAEFQCSKGLPGYWSTIELWATRWSMWFEHALPSQLERFHALVKEPAWHKENENEKDALDKLAGLFGRLSDNQMIPNKALGNIMVFLLSLKEWASSPGFIEKQPLPSVKKPTSIDVPLNRTIRRLIDAVLVSDADFDAFCMDIFPDVEKRFGGGMERTAKDNLLLKQTEPDRILECLRAAHPAAAAEVLGL